MLLLSSADRPDLGPTCFAKVISRGQNLLIAELMLLYCQKNDWQTVKTCIRVEEAVKPGILLLYIWTFFARILFSRIALKDILSTLKC